MKSSPAITASSRPRFRATSSDFDAAAAATRPVAGGENRVQVRRHEGASLATAAADGGPPVARQHPGGAFAGRALLAGEQSPEARRGHRRRRARRGSPLLVELGEIAGERLVPVYALRVFKLTEAAASRRAADAGRSASARRGGVGRCRAQPVRRAVDELEAGPNG